MAKRKDLRELFDVNLTDELIGKIVDCVTNPNTDTFDKLTKEYIESCGWWFDSIYAFKGSRISINLMNFNDGGDLYIYNGSCQVFIGVIKTTHDFDVICRCLNI